MIVIRWIYVMTDLPGRRIYLGVTRLSLSAHDRQALDRIEEALASADPPFAARLSAFSQLADGTVMPERERLSGRGRAGGRGKHGLILWVVVLMWVSISLALILVAIALSSTAPQSGCTAGQTSACVRRAVPSAPSSRPGGT
jgi:hypothetical protein